MIEIEGPKTGSFYINQDKYVYKTLGLSTRDDTCGMIKEFGRIIDHIMKYCKKTNSFLVWREKVNFASYEESTDNYFGETIVRCRLAIVPEPNYEFWGSIGFIKDECCEYKKF